MFVLGGRFASLFKKAVSPITNLWSSAKQPGRKGEASTVTALYYFLLLKIYNIFIVFLIVVLRKLPVCLVFSKRF